MPTDLPKITLQNVSALRPVEVAVAVCGKSRPGRELPEGLRSALAPLMPSTGAEGARAEAPWGRGSIASLTRLGAAGEIEDRDLDGWLGRELAAAESRGAARLVVVLPRCRATRRRGGPERLLTALAQMPYRFDRYLQDADKAKLRSVAVVAPTGLEKEYRAALRTARAVARGMTLTRDLANTPPNVATPAWIAAQARALARRHGMKAQVLTPRELERRGMGGILGVGQGSANAPRLVRLTSSGESGPRVALVGKGVTFDTGGISIKPSASMEEMKYDKCGACTVLGIAEAVGVLRLGLRLSVYVPLAENMPDAAAYRPSDIVTCYNGKTVEIINTDAEGRMILADALAWACEEEPEHLLEFSTLTGASVVALGEGAASLYTPSDALARAIEASAESSGERLWRMPLWPEFVRQMKGTHSDLKNSGPRWGGANTAAAFLSQFIDGVDRWAHIDIAGPAYGPDAEGRGKRGATGYGVAFAVNFLQGLV